MKNELIKVAILSSISAACLMILLIISLSSPLIMGDDPYGLLRYVIIRLTAIAIAVPVLTGLMLAVDYVTPANWMEAIGNDPKACSYIMAAVVLVIGAVLCWT
jgi:succinate dehydrogenase hydrophobic anchor subunit